MLADGGIGGSKILCVCGTWVHAVCWTWVKISSQIEVSHYVIQGWTELKEAVSFAYGALFEHMVGLMELDAGNNGDRKKEDRNLKMDDGNEGDADKWVMVSHSALIGSE